LASLLTGIVQAMNWFLPTPLLTVAGVVTLLSHALLQRRQVSLPRFVAEVLTITLGVIALVWLAWVVLWLLEQRR
jgi:hypothetical protein